MRTRSMLLCLGLSVLIGCQLLDTVPSASSTQGPFIPATEAQLGRPAKLVTDTQGNIIFTDVFNHKIRVLTPEGVIYTLVGSGKAGSNDGQGTNGQLRKPEGIARGLEGTFYIADTGNHCIRKLTPNGILTTLAGKCSKEGRGLADGRASTAKFNQPGGIAVDAQGVIYIADTFNHRIRKLTPEGQVMTLAGGDKGYVDGMGSQALFNGPSGLTVDGAGNIFVADTNNHRIRKVSPDNRVSTLAGSDEYKFLDGELLKATFAFPSDVALDKSGNLYVADTDHNRIRKINPTTMVETIAGSGPLWPIPYTTGFRAPGYQDDSAFQAKFNHPTGIAIQGNQVIVADTYNERIRLVTQSGLVSTLAGQTVTNQSLLYEYDTPDYDLDKGESGAMSSLSQLAIYPLSYPKLEGQIDGPALQARFNQPTHITVGSTGNVHVHDTGNGLLRKITPSGNVSTLAEAKFSFRAKMAMDSKENIYMVEEFGLGVFKITRDGKTSSIFPDIPGWSPNDQKNHKGRYNSEYTYSTTTNIAIDNQDQMFIAVHDNPNSIWKINSNLKAEPLIGKKSDNRYDLFIVSQLLATTHQGELYLVPNEYNPDFTELNKISTKITLQSTKAIQSFARIPKTPADRDQNRFGISHLVFDTQGIGYFTQGNQIYRLMPDGQWSVFAGSTEAGYRDGTKETALFSNPTGLAIDKNNEIYVADTANNRIRKINPTGEVSTFAGSGVK